MVALVLDDRACGQNRLRVLCIMCQRVAQELERLEILADSDVQQTNCGQYFGVLWRELKPL